MIIEGANCHNCHKSKPECEKRGVRYIQKNCSGCHVYREGFGNEYRNYSPVDGFNVVYNQHMDRSGKTAIRGKLVKSGVSA